MQNFVNAQRRKNLATAMKVGDVRIADDEDFCKLREMIDGCSGWKSEYEKTDKRGHSVKVFTRAPGQNCPTMPAHGGGFATTHVPQLGTCDKPGDSVGGQPQPFKVFKAIAHFADVKPSLLYDVLLDPGFRKTWDTNMIDGYEICCINPNNDIGYYSLKCVKPLKNRDFVLQRSWLQTTNERIIISHSVFHDKLPPQKNFVRGTIHMTGYLVRPGDRQGCTLGYVSHVDPKGSMPPWVVNKATTVYAPKVFKKLHKACYNYDDWKRENQPNYKPWLYPEQITLPKVDLRETALREYEEQECRDDEWEVIESNGDGIDASESESTSSDDETKEKHSNGSARKPSVPLSKSSAPSTPTKMGIFRRKKAENKPNNKVM